MEKTIYKADLLITNVKGEKEGKKYDFCTLEVQIDGYSVKLFCSEKLGNQIIKNALHTLEKVEE